MKWRKCKEFKIQNESRYANLNLMGDAHVSSLEIKSYCHPFLKITIKRIDFDHDHSLYGEISLSST